MYLEVSYTFPKTGNAPKAFGHLVRNGSIDSQRAYLFLEERQALESRLVPDELMLLEESNGEMVLMSDYQTPIRMFGIPYRFGYIAYGSDACDLLERSAHKVRLLFQNRVSQPVIETRVGGPMHIHQRAGELRTYNLMNFVPRYIPQGMDHIDWKKEPELYDSTYALKLPEMIRQELQMHHEKTVYPIMGQRLASIVRREIERASIEIVETSRKYMMTNDLMLDSGIETRKTVPYWTNVIFRSSFFMNYPLTIGRWSQLGYGYINYTERPSIARNNTVARQG